MTAQSVEIQVLGRHFKINCPPQEQKALHHAVANLNQRLQDLKQRIKVISTEQLIVVVALNLCHELEQEKQQREEDNSHFTKKVHLLQAILEQALTTVK